MVQYIFIGWVCEAPAAICIKFMPEISLDMYPSNQNLSGQFFLYWIEDGPVNTIMVTLNYSTVPGQT